jgi:hypothetical protein
MKPFATALLASAFALSATLAVAQSDPHHPAEDAGGDPAAAEQVTPETPVEPAPRPMSTDAACPDAPSMMMEMMMGAGGSPMPMMKMMELMQGMQELQTEQMKLLRELLAEVRQERGEQSP